MFFATYDLEKAPDHWVRNRRTRIESRCIGLLTTLCQAFRDSGNLHEASQWDLRMATLFPENPAATGMAWRQQAECPEVETCLAESRLKEVATARLRVLDTPEREALARLSIFPGGFTTTQAEAIVGVNRVELHSLLYEGFLQ